MPQQATSGSGGIGNQELHLQANGSSLAPASAASSNWLIDQRQIQTEPNPKGSSDYNHEFEIKEIS